MKAFINDFYSVFVQPTDFTIPGNPNTNVYIYVNNANSLTFINTGNRNVQIGVGGIILNAGNKFELKNDMLQLYKGKLTVSFRKSVNPGKLLVIRKFYK